MVDVSAEWALVITTIGLVLATGVLVYATWNLFLATRSMDRRASLRERHTLILRKIELSRIVSAVTHGEFIDRLKGGSVPGAYSDILELAGILEYAKDSVVIEPDVRRIVGVLTQANIGATYAERNAEEEWAVLRRVQEQLNGSLSGWYDELGRIAFALGRALETLTQRQAIEPKNREM